MMKQWMVKRKLLLYVTAFIHAVTVLWLQDLSFDFIDNVLQFAL